MRQWGMVQGCELCGERDEKIDHLFFARPYSYTWNGLARQLVGNCVNPDWKQTVNRLQRMGGTGLNSILEKLLFQITVYDA